MLVFDVIAQGAAFWVSGVVPLLTGVLLHLALAAVAVGICVRKRGCGCRRGKEGGDEWGDIPSLRSAAPGTVFLMNPLGAWCAWRAWCVCGVGSVALLGARTPWSRRLRRWTFRLPLGRAVLITMQRLGWVFTAGLCWVGLCFLVAAASSAKIKKNHRRKSMLSEVYVNPMGTSCSPPPSCGPKARVLLSQRVMSRACVRRVVRCTTVRVPLCTPPLSLVLCRDTAGGKATWRGLNCQHQCGGVVCYPCPTHLAVRTLFWYDSNSFPAVLLALMLCSSRYCFTCSALSLFASRCLKTQRACVCAFVCSGLLRSRTAAPPSLFVAPIAGSIPPSRAELEGCVARCVRRCSCSFMPWISCFGALAQIFLCRDCGLGCVLVEACAMFCMGCTTPCDCHGPYPSSRVLRNRALREVKATPARAGGAGSGSSMSAAVMRAMGRGRGDSSPSATGGAFHAGACVRAHLCCRAMLFASSQAPFRASVLDVSRALCGPQCLAGGMVHGASLSGSSPSASKEPSFVVSNPMGSAGV
jgi:hypothetical protein